MKTAAIYDATQDNFAELVLGNSERGLVLVNYWSPRVGPCLKLWTALEPLAKEYAGRFLLINVNTDSQRQLAAEHGVRSLPTVKLFLKRKVVDEIHGAESAHGLRKVIDRHLPRPSDVDVAKAVQMYQQGKPDEAYRCLRQVIGRDPDNLSAIVTYAKLQFRDDHLEALQAFLAALPSDQQQQSEVAALLAHAQFTLAARSAPTPQALAQTIDENPADLDARYCLAALKLFEDDYESALQQLIEIIQRDANFRAGAARTGMTAIFQLLGRNHDLTRVYRSRLLDSLA